MIIKSANLDGVKIIDIEPHADERGYFARTWCIDEFAEAGLQPTFLQASISHNTAAGTLRGMHVQLEPHSESKLIRCLAGSAYDVLLDLRPTSSSFLAWQAFELTAENQRGLFVPPGIAHGFQTLSDATMLSYQIDQRYAPGHAAGVRWNDPVFGIEWPETQDRIMSEKDSTWPDFDPDRGLTAAR